MLQPMEDNNSPAYKVTPGIKGYPIVGVMFDALRNPLEMITRNAIGKGDIIPFKIAGRPVVQLNHPDLIMHVLVDSYRNYDKSDT